VFCFVSFLQIKVVIRKEMVVVLRADHLILQFLLDVLVGVKECCLVLAQFVVIVLIIEIFRIHVSAFRQRISELIHNSLKASGSFSTSFLLFVRQELCIDIELMDLLINILHCFLNVALLSISGEVQWFKRGKHPHHLLIGNGSIFSLYFSGQRLILLQRKLISKSVNICNKIGGVYVASFLTVNIIDDCVKLISIFFDELFSQELDGAVVLDLFLKYFSERSFAVIF
jgi:hypothetical protein